MSALPVIAATSVASLLIAGSSGAFVKKTIYRNITIEANKPEYAHLKEQHLTSEKIKDLSFAHGLVTGTTLIGMAIGVAVIASIYIYSGMVLFRVIAPIVSNYHYPIHHLALMNQAIKISSCIGLGIYIYSIPSIVSSINKPDWTKRVINEMLPQKDPGN